MLKHPCCFVLSIYTHFNNWTYDCSQFKLKMSAPARKCWRTNYVRAQRLVSTFWLRLKQGLLPVTAVPSADELSLTYDMIEKILAKRMHEDCRVGVLQVSHWPKTLFLRPQSHQASEYIKGQIRMSFILKCDAYSLTQSRLSSSEPQLSPFSPPIAAQSLLIRPELQDKVLNGV